MNITLQRSRALLVGIVCLGAALRVRFFTGLAFADDPDYAARAYSLFVGREHLYTDNNGLRIGTWYPAALGYTLFGVNDFGLVIYPLIMSVIGILTIAWLGTRLFDRRTGLFAASLLAFYPLDVELATRLLPDALLAACSLIAVGLLFSGDIAQEDRATGPLKLQRPWTYVCSGIAFGWCVAVNVSAVALFVFLGCYVILSTQQLVRASPHSLPQRLVVFFGVRSALLLAGMLVIALPEAFLYRLEFGSFLTKYQSTFSHYNLEGRDFFRDLWFYPENMLFLRRGWVFRVPPPEYRPYGFFFVAAVPSLVYGLLKGGRRFRMAALWAISVFAFLEWGSTNLTSWTFLHRLDRHLEMVTPALILLIAFALSRLADTRWGALASAAALLSLFGTSLTTIDRRHAETVDRLSLMQPVHEVLDVFQPAHVYVDTQTGAYERFLDRFDDRRAYHDIDTMPRELAENAMVLVLSDPLPKTLDESRLSPRWRLVTALNVSGQHAPKTIRAYKVEPTVFEPIDADKPEAVLAHVRALDPGRVTDGARLLFHWDGMVDGVEQIELRGQVDTPRHLEFSPAKNVTRHWYRPVEHDQSWEYDVITEAGRGEVTIVDRPSPHNDFTLVIRVDDARDAGAARYRWFVVARPVDSKSATSSAASDRRSRQ